MENPNPFDFSRIESQDVLIRLADGGFVVYSCDTLERDILDVEHVSLPYAEIHQILADAARVQSRGI